MHRKFLWVSVVSVRQFFYGAKESGEGFAEKPSLLFLLFSLDLELDGIK